MPKLSLTKEQKKQVESYMKTYKINKKLLRMEKYHKAYMGGDNTEHMAEAEKEMLNETPFARARMFDVRHFILSLDNSDEKLLLYYHYIKGESVERCAELLGVSRRSAFRMKNRALAMVYDKMMTASGGRA